MSNKKAAVLGATRQQVENEMKKQNLFCNCLINYIGELTNVK